MARLMPTVIDGIGPTVSHQIEIDVLGYRRFVNQRFETTAVIARRELADNGRRTQCAVLLLWHRYGSINRVRCPTKSMASVCARISDRQSSLPYTMNCVRRRLIIRSASQ